MYLPDELASAKVLITVKTYPLPSGKYDELVCTAGILPDGKWIRIYPVPFRALPYEQQYRKFDVIELDLVRNMKDFRPESFRPRRGPDEIIRPVGHIGRADNWRQRKDYVLKEVYSSMTELIVLAKGSERKSLATLQAKEIIDFVIEPTEREWKERWRDQMLQMNLFDRDAGGEGKLRQVVSKLPYKYSYKLLTDGDSGPRTMMIEDWEIGALYWKCLKQCEGEEDEANKLVRKKYLDE